MYVVLKWFLITNVTWNIRFTENFFQHIDWKDFFIKNQKKYVYYKVDDFF